MFYKGEGWLEEAQSCAGERPQRVEIIRMERELGLPYIDDIEITDDKKAWEYYHKLKATIEEKKRQSA